ncbi:MAG: GNAT family N-acetyltransferase [Defluviitaleaceae bacterium]|nr:GNAT family N-acetyltransferase [Defluviitaleaceae bacterium]
MQKIDIRFMNKNEIDFLADFIARGYSDDIFFKWVVPPDSERHGVLTEYYKCYLEADEAQVYVAQTGGEIAGATVWLPHDTNPALYEKIEAATGIFAPNFAAVADASHKSEPKNTPFTQLVGFAVDKPHRGRGIGSELLRAHLKTQDALGIPTYAEASTAFHPGNVYGKLGYTRLGELMVFSPKAVLYPLFRAAL